MAFNFFFHLFFYCEERKSSVRIWKISKKWGFSSTLFFALYFFSIFLLISCCRLDILSHCIRSTINSDKWKHMKSSILKYKQKTHTSFCWHPVGVSIPPSFRVFVLFFFICYFSAFYTQGMCHTHIVKIFGLSAIKNIANECVEKFEAVERDMRDIQNLKRSRSKWDRKYSCAFVRHFDIPILLSEWLLLLSWIWTFYAKLKCKHIYIINCDGIFIVIFVYSTFGSGYF